MGAGFTESFSLRLLARELLLLAGGSNARQVARRAAQAVLHHFTVTKVPAPLWNMNPFDSLVLNMTHVVAAPFPLLRALVQTLWVGAELAAATVEPIPHASKSYIHSQVRRHQATSELGMNRSAVLFSLLIFDGLPRLLVHHWGCRVLLRWACFKSQYERVQGFYRMSLVYGLKRLPSCKRLFPSQLLYQQCCASFTIAVH